jgi:hypothetical protein
MSGNLTVAASVNAPSGYVSAPNPWGTANSAFFPNGISTAGGSNWIYGLTYLGNAPSNGSGAEVASNGRSYFRNANTSGTWGYAGQFVDRNNAANNYASYSFEHEFGNHSWGLVARFHIQQVGADRPSIQFSNATNNTRWSIGYVYPDDNFRITQNHAMRPDNSGNDGWGTERFRINTDGTAYFFSSLTATAFFESSDSRLKVLKQDDVQVEGIENLKAKLYIKDGREEYGYFAQEVQTYMPSVITENDKGYLNLSYREVHTAKIARLEKRVAELEKQLNLK